MSRSEERRTYATAGNESGESFNEAQNSYNQAQEGVQNYRDQLAKFAASNPYKAGGEFQTSLNKETANISDAAGQAAGQAVQGAAVRTGQNAGGAIAATEAMEAKNARDLSAEQAGLNANRIGAEAGYNEKTLGASSLPASLEAGLTGTMGKMSDDELAVRQKAAETPSFMDTLGSNYASSMGSYLADDTQQGIQMGMACPAEGSLYLMPDGGERLVESLQVGELLAGIDGEPQRIEEIESGPALILEVTTRNGFTGRNSRVHAYALPFGGFAVAARCLGKKILTADGASDVIRVRLAGQAKVFNVITDGSHTYRADGIWALGVGEAERAVSMDAWNTIADKLQLGTVGEAL